MLDAASAGCWQLQGVAKVLASIHHFSAIQKYLSIYLHTQDAGSIYLSIYLSTQYAGCCLPIYVSICLSTQDAESIYLFI